MAAGAAWIAGLVLAVALLDAPPFLSGVASLTGAYDNASFNFPVRVETARQWAAGRLPLWNPYKFAGFPLLGDITTAALYPGQLPFLLDTSGRRYRALDQVAALHFVLAGVFMYVFARALSLGRSASSLSGLVYAGNGMLLFLASRWIQAQNAAVWLPLVLAAIARAGALGDFRLWTAIGAVAVALQLLSGYPQYSFYTGLMAGAFALVLIIGRREHRWRPVWALLLIYALGAALSAVQLLPAIEILGLSRRGSGVSLEEFLSLPAAPSVLGTLVLPRMVTVLMHPLFIAGGLFVGTLTVVLAVEGARSTRREQVFLTAALVVTFLLALGPFTPIGPLAYQLPGLNAFRYPFKHLLEVVFCLAALAGFGAQSLLDGRRGARTCVAIGALVVTCWVLFHLRAAPVWHWSMPVTAAGTSAFLALVLLRQHRAAVAVALLLVWLGLAANRNATLAFDHVAIRDRPRIVDTLEERKETVLGPRYAVLIPPRAKRVNGRELLVLDFPGEFQIPSVHGSSPFAWNGFRQALAMTEDGAFRLPEMVFGRVDQTLNVLGVRYVGTPSVEQNGTTVYDDGTVMVVERPTAHPALRFVDRALCMNPYQTSRHLRRRSYDAATTALLDCEGKPPLPPITPASTRARISVLDADPGFLRMRVRLQRGGPGLLVVSQSDIPGWRARVDGEPVPIYRAYGLVQALVVPDGLHEVELEYRPDTLLVGAGVSAAALAVVLVLGVTGYRARRRSSR